MCNCFSVIVIVFIKVFSTQSIILPGQAGPRLEIFSSSTPGLGSGPAQPWLGSGPAGEMCNCFSFVIVIVPIKVLSSSKYYSAGPGRGPKVGPKMVPKRVPKVDPKPDPLWGAQVLGKAMNSKGFGAFWPPRGIQIWDHFLTPGFWEYSKKNEGIGEAE